MAGFTRHQSISKLAPQMTYPKGRFIRHQSPTTVNPTPWGQPPHNGEYTVVMAILTACQSERQSSLSTEVTTAGHTQFTTTTGGHTQFTQGTFLENSAQVTMKVL